MWKAQRHDVCGPWGEFSWGEDKLHSLNRVGSRRGRSPGIQDCVARAKLQGIFVLGLGTGTCALGLPGLCLGLRDVGFLVWTFQGGGTD